jgi:hypothetical protein
MGDARVLPVPAPVSQWWLLVAAGALGLGALAALALVVARTPGVTTLLPADAFPRALVVHVNLATLIWYVAMAGALWTEQLAAPRRRAATLAFGVALAGAVGVVAAGLTAAGAPVLANYIPFVDHPSFLAALACFAAGGLATALLSLRRPRDAAEWGFAIARWPFLMAALDLVLRLGSGASLVDALWGAGHILQFGHLTLLMAIWLRLVERAGGTPLATRPAVALFAAAALPATAAPLLQLVGMAGDAALHQFHTELMRWANWPAPLLFGLLLGLRSPAAAWRADGFPASIGLFVAGCLAGMAIDRQTTMIPAHYHGTIGAFTLALMAAALSRLSPPARAGAVSPRARPTRLPLTLYALGISALIAGLAWSGALGAPRKSPFSGEGADLGATLAASLTGLGGTVTVAGVLLFVIVAVPRIVPLCAHRPASVPPPARDAAPTFAAAR